DQANERPDLMFASPLRRVARVVNMSELAKALNHLTDPPVKAVFVYNSNPVAVAPNHNDVVRGFLRPDLFTVVHEQFFTDTTRYADLLLPATTFLEHKDLQKSYGHYYVQISQPAVAPLGECKSNTDLFRELANRMGFPEPCFQETVDQMIDLALAKPHPRGWLEGITRERLEKEGHVRLNLGDGPFLPRRPWALFSRQGQGRVVQRNPRCRCYGSSGFIRSSAGVPPRGESSAVSPGVALAQGRQLLELNVLQQRIHAKARASRLA